MLDVPVNIPPSTGTYALVFACRTAVRRAVGRLGTLTIAGGYWVYVGSAFGPGGLPSRINHHLSPTTRPHWHLDYIKDALTPLDVWCTVDPIPREHDWASILAGLRGASRPLTGFGSSDCGCPSHLIHLSRRPGFDGFSQGVHRRLAHHAACHRWQLADPDGRAAKEGDRRRPG